MRDADPTVIQAARDLHLFWPTVMGAFRTSMGEVVDAPLPEAKVLSSDEIRRGKMKWEQDPESGRWHLTRGRWHTGFVDVMGHGGLLGQVEGRTSPTSCLAVHHAADLAHAPLLRRRRHVGNLPRSAPACVGGISAGRTLVVARHGGCGSLDLESVGEDTFQCVAAEAGVDRLLWCVAFLQVTPGDPGPDLVEHSVDDLPERHRGRLVAARGIRGAGNSHS